MLANPRRPFYFLQLKGSRVKANKKHFRYLQVCFNGALNEANYIYTKHVVTYGMNDHITSTILKFTSDLTQDK